MKIREIIENTVRNSSLAYMAEIGFKHDYENYIPQDLEKSIQVLVNAIYKNIERNLKG